MASNASGNESFKSYTEYVNFLALHNDHYQWLASFFNAKEVKRNKHDYLTILDSQGEGLKPAMIPLNEVAKCPASIKTRIVFFRYEEVETIDRKALDSLALNLNLPPFFLWQHLSLETWTDFQQLPNKAALGLRHKFRDTRYHSFEVGDHSFRHLSVLSLQPEDSSGPVILLMLVRECTELKNLVVYDPNLEVCPSNATKIMKVPSAKRMTLAEHFLRSLRKMTPKECFVADQAPLDYTLHYLSLVLDAIAFRLAIDRSYLPMASEPGFNDPETLNSLGGHLSDHTAAAEQIKSELDLYFRRKSLVPSPATLELREDLEDFLHEIRATRNLLQTITATQVSFLALEESKKSIQQAESGKRLSQLAYVYLPLAFSASLFGMNVRDFQETSLSSFVIVAIIFLILSLLLWWSFEPLLKTSQALRRGKICHAIIWEVVLRSPSSAMVLALFVLRYGYENARQVMAHLDLFKQFNLESSEPSDHFDMDLTFLGGSLRVQNWWHRRFERVSEVTGRSGWKDNFFWRRTSQHPQRRLWGSNRNSQQSQNP